MSIGAMVRRFNTVDKVPTSMFPRLPNVVEEVRLLDLIQEELVELAQALAEGDIVEVADALADIIYVTAQQAEALGFPVDVLLTQVQESNMSKLGSDGKPIFRTDGKVLKGPDFRPPDIREVLYIYGADL